MDNATTATFPSRPYLTAREIATAIGAHEKTVRVWALRGRFPPPARVTGRLLRWAAADVMAVMESRRQQRPA